MRLVPAEKPFALVQCHLPQGLPRATQSAGSTRPVSAGAEVQYDAVCDEGPQLGDSRAPENKGRAVCELKRSIPPVA